MQDRSPPARRNHLQRTAGPYIRVNDRDRGEPCGSTPPTPPYVRARIRRFEKVPEPPSIREGRPRAFKGGMGGSPERAVLWPRDQRSRAPAAVFGNSPPAPSAR